MSLFDAFDAPLPDSVRPSDPDTSHAAAASIAPVLSAQRRDVLAAAAAVADANPHRTGATAAEIVMRLAYTGRAPQQSVVARRLSDLRDLGLVVDSGARRPGTSARALIAWQVTDAGREALR